MQPCVRAHRWPPPLRCRFQTRDAACCCRQVRNLHLLPTRSPRPTPCHCSLRLPTPADPCSSNQCGAAGSPGCTGTSATNYTCGACRTGYTGLYCTACAAGWTQSGSGLATVCGCGANKYVKSGVCTTCGDGAASNGGLSSTTCGEHGGGQVASHVEGSPGGLQTDLQGGLRFRPPAAVPQLLSLHVHQPMHPLPPLLQPARVARLTARSQTSVVSQGTRWQATGTPSATGIAAHDSRAPAWPLARHRSRPRDITASPPCLPAPVCPQNGDAYTPGVGCSSSSEGSRRALLTPF
jgi:hypothetical protein